VTYFGDEVADRVPFMIRTLVAIWTVFVLVAICLISRKPITSIEEVEVAELSNLQTGEYQDVDSSGPSQEEAKKSTSKQNLSQPSIH